jgi:hypothetical protein
MANAYQKEEVKSLLDKDKNKSEAEVLGQFSECSEWWIQLYVAGKLRKNPKLRSSVNIEKLKQSKHPLVHEILKESQEK